MPDLSVVIVNWNAKKYIDQCLRSILDSDCVEDMQIVVVDNGSTDGSVELISNKYKQITLICTNENLGFARGNNVGIRQCHGDYLLLINSDVEVRPDTISTIIDYMEKHDEVGMVGPRIVGVDGRVQRSWMGFPSLWNMFCRAVLLDTVFPQVKLFNGFMRTYLQHDAITEVDIINGCFWAVRRKALDQVGFLDDGFFMYAEDMDWCKRFHAAGWKVVYFPRAEALHYGGASSANAPVRFYVEMQKANHKYWCKHYGIISRAVFTCIVILHQFVRIISNFIRYLVVPRMRDMSRYKTNRSIATLRSLLGRHSA